MYNHRHHPEKVERSVSRLNDYSAHLLTPNIQVLPGTTSCPLNRCRSQPERCAPDPGITVWIPLRGVRLFLETFDQPTSQSTYPCETSALMGFENLSTFNRCRASICAVLQKRRQRLTTIGSNPYLNNNRSLRWPAPPRASH